MKLTVIMGGGRQSRRAYAEQLTTATTRCFWEPEDGLPPDVQLDLGRDLARLLHAGADLLVTTWSDWLLRELSRLMLASRLAPHQLRRHGLLPIDVIDPARVVLLHMDAVGEVQPVLFGEMGFTDPTNATSTADLNRREQRMYLDLDMSAPAATDVSD